MRVQSSAISLMCSQHTRLFDKYKALGAFNRVVHQDIDAATANASDDKHCHHEFTVRREGERVISVVVIDYIFERGTLLSVVIKALDAHDDDCIELHQVCDI